MSQKQDKVSEAKVIYLKYERKQRARSRLSQRFGKQAFVRVKNNSSFQKAFMWFKLLFFLCIMSLLLERCGI